MTEAKNNEKLLKKAGAKLRHRPFENSFNVYGNSVAFFRSWGI